MNQAKKAIIATFPAEFGLRDYPGEKFRIGFRESYYNGAAMASIETRTLMLYTQRWVESRQEWLDFAKGTESELRAQVKPL